MDAPKPAEAEALRALLVAVESPPEARPGTGEAGGANVYIASLAPALARRGIEVDIAVRSTDPGQPPVAPLQPGLKGVRVLNVRAGPAAPVPKEALPELLNEVARAVRRTGRRTGPYHLISSHAWMSGQVALDLAARWDVPLVHHPHSLGLARNRAAGVPPSASSGRLAVEERIVDKADLLVAASNSERIHLVHEYGAPAERVRVVHPGVDHELFRPGDPLIARDRLRQQLRADRLPRHLLAYVGRLHPVKGIELAIDTLAELRRQHIDVELVVVGGPHRSDDDCRFHRQSEEDELQRLRERVGGVRFLGARSRSELPFVYQAADLLLVPSWDEPFGLIALEAQSCGTPVVAARVGGLTEVVADGTGLLLEARAAPAWAAAVAGLLVEPSTGQRPGGHRMRRLPAMREAAACHATGFSWDTTTAKLVAVWAEALASRRQPSPAAPRR